MLAGDNPGHRDLPDDEVIPAADLGPADLLEYPRHKLRGLLLEEGSAASHAAIVARALQIPCVGRLQGLRDRLSEGDQVIVDGETGEAYLRPRPDMLAAVQTRMAVRAQRRAEFDLLRDTPAITKDGTRITVLTNAGLAVDLENLDATGAEGIGLFRTEFQFMVSDELPRLDAQTALYKLVLDAAVTGPSPSARSISAATRSCPISTMSAKRTRPWAVAPFVWGSTHRPCCGCRCAPFWPLPPGASCASCSR